MAKLWIIGGLTAAFLAACGGLIGDSPKLCCVPCQDEYPYPDLGCFPLGVELLD